MKNRGKKGVTVLLALSLCATLLVMALSTIRMK